jgi:fructosamine-3-kinase
VRSYLSSQIEAITGLPPAEIRPLTGGSVGHVFLVRLPDGERLVAKVAEGAGATLHIEGAMLAYLAQRSALPVPEVVYSSAELLVMAHVEGESAFTAPAQQHAAELLAGLHAIPADRFGFDGDTLIGGLPQPNPRHDAWLTFFRDQRLLFMAGEAARAGRLPVTLLPRLERFAARLDNWLIEPDRPSLLHGDVWTTNVLARGDQITAFLDPAIYYGEPEIELAFITLFGTFGRPFFERYGEIRPLRAGFFETRRDIYNLYPLLVHVRLFGGGYVAAVDQTLARFGF